MAGPLGYEDAILFLPFSQVSGGATADAVGSRIGVLKGSASLAVDGAVGSGVRFPSAGAFVEVAHDASLATSEGSIAFWARPQAIGTLQGLVSKDANSYGAGGHTSVLLRADGFVSFRIQSTTTTYEIFSDRKLSPGDWSHVAVTWGAQGMRLFLDGALAGANAYAGGLTGNGEPIAIGASLARSAANSSVGVSDFFRGDIDEVGFFDRQLDADALATIIAGEVAPNEAPVVASRIADQAAVAGAPFAFALPAGVFTDPDGDALTLSASLASGAALPSWLVFDGARFVGTPPAAASGQIALRVTASDGQATAADDFDLTVAAAAQQTPDAVAVFAFSETAGRETRDAVGGHVGVLKGAATLGGPGAVGSGLSLPGGGAFVEVAHDPDFALANGTLSFSVRPQALGVAQGLVSKDANGYGTGGHFTLQMRADGLLNLRVQTTATSYEITSNKALAAGTWADVSVSWGAEGMRMYIDGALVGTRGYTGGLTGNAEPWAIGASLVRSANLSSVGVSDFFRGQIDELAIFDRQLAPTGASTQLSFAGQTGRAKVVDLALGFQSDAVRVMPLGDSNTAGWSNIYDMPQYRGYRNDLWSEITRDGMFVDFVGAGSNGPATMPDRDHQGVGGIAATTVVGQAAALGAAHRPDVVLLMLGTNDALRESNAANTVPNELLSIMRSLDRADPDVAILIAPLPPMQPRAADLPIAPQTRAAINAQLPGIVEQARALGIDATFVPVPNLVVTDLYDGVHPTPAGYRKLATAWYAALEDRLAGGDFGGPRTTVSGVRNVEGSELGDYLRGDVAANALNGRGGADRIEGGRGQDLLSGGSGGDVFVFRSAAEGGDRISDFTRGADYIEVSAAGFGGGLVFGATPILRSAATPTASGSSGQFLYDTDDGRLTWDANGANSGGAQLIATLSGAPQLLAGDLLIL